jgi:hypothetical protein
MQNEPVFFSILLSALYPIVRIMVYAYSPLPYEGFILTISLMSV